MPYFTLQFTAEGPIVNAVIGVSVAREGALTAQKLPVPPPIRVRGLIDTGATGTCVDPSILTTLGINPTGSVPVCTPSSGSIPVMKDQYDVAILIPGADPAHSPLVIGTLAVVSAELLTQGFQALIGRDILSRCLMTYDGANGFFSLAD